MSRAYVAAILLAVLLTVTPVAAFTRYDEDSCKIIGDTDIYGIGVRTGYYLTFSAGVVALIFKDSKGITDCLKLVNIIFAAVLIVLIRNASIGSFAVLECQISAILVFFLPATSLIWSSFAVDNPGLASWGFFYILYGIYGVIQPWLFWKLLNQGRKESCPSFKMFVFAPFDFYNPNYVRAGKLASVILCVGLSAFILIGACCIYYGMRGATSLSGTPFGKVAKRGKDQIKGMMGLAPQEGKKLGRFRAIGVVAVLASGAHAMVIVEKIISINHIDLSEVAFTSTGQLIPFLVGLFTFLATLWSCLFPKKENGGESSTNSI